MNALEVFFAIMTVVALVAAYLVRRHDQKSGKK